MFELIRQPWPWYVAGAVIGLTVPALLLLGNKHLGISSSLRHLCAACLPANITFFKYDWKKEIWNLFFVVGVLLGGVVATQFLTNPEGIIISEKTVADLQ
ncbi:MAG TPA: YeeE/YedE thiosulfate transporter family protein, partial [Cyclobacteriaceae bacterium]|nr:YeeE/YedE thiosulfate transporter family protein [Cyclobacteriaceae bacterium]